MASGLFENTSIPFRLLISLVIILGSFLVFSVIGTLLVMLVYGADPVMILEGLSDPDDPHVLNMLRFLQVVQSLGLFIIPSLLLAYLLSSHPGHFLGFRQCPGWPVWITGGLVLIVAIPLINVLAEWNMAVRFPDFLEGVEEWMRSREEEASRLTEAFLEFDRPGGLWISLLIVAMIPALGEELLFRGVVQRLFTEWWRNVPAAVVVTAILFSALHLQFFGFVPRMLMGIWFGYLLVWSGTLWLPILSHFLNNAVIVVFYFLMERGMINSDIEHIGATPGSYWTGILSVILTGVMIWMVYRQGKGVSPDQIS
ncbi:MAG TPA: CPBP family intramembrane metalloprotease [Bacteroidetes bacterium]|nr:CPBP family intramembrane metalloprotease [Bacteroidota bacterium]